MEICLTTEGNFLLTEEEKNEVEVKDPGINQFIKTFYGAEDFLHNKPRYCIWLKDVLPAKYKSYSCIIERIKSVQSMRSESSREATRELAKYPMLFAEIRQPAKSYILIPRHSSERRNYIPIGFLEPEIIAGDSCLIIPYATLYDFGILTSTMHMALTRYVCGTLEMRYRYSKDIVYNNFPWPSPSAKQKEDI